MFKSHKNSNAIVPAQIIIEIILIIIAVCGFGAYVVYHHSVLNNASPVISVSDENNTFSVKADDAEFLSDVVATDEEDGDVSDSLVIESISPFIKKNTRTITYVAFDSSNNVTKLERNIEYSDYTSPQFTNGKHIYVTHGRVSEILEQMSATDCVDGDVSEKIKLEINNVIENIPGDYSIKASVTNSCADVTSAVFIVTVTGEGR